MKGALLGVLVPLVAAAQQEELLAPRPEEFGAMVAPAALPDGALALWGWVGAPELAVGMRQGISGLELGAQARVDWVRLGLLAQGELRRRVYASGPWVVAPALGVGVGVSSGVRYLDEAAFTGVQMRVEPALWASFRAAETVSLVGRVGLPAELSLSAPGARRLQALGALGTEIYVGQGFSVTALGELGVEGMRPPGEHTQVRLGYAVRLGMGWRLF